MCQHPFRCAKDSPHAAGLQNRGLPVRRRLQGTQAEAFSAHPGVIQTNLGRHMNGPAHWGMKIFMAAARWMPAMRAKSIPQVIASSQRVPTIYYRRFNVLPSDIQRQAAHPDSRQVCSSLC